MPTLPRSSSAKQSFGSSRGFRSSRGFARVLRARTQPLDPVGVEVQVSLPEVPEVAPQVEVRETHQELCSICLETLDDYSFAYPCGQGHRLHYGCMVHFLGNILSLPLSDGPGVLSPEEVKSLGSGFKAVQQLEKALRRITPETKLKLACPLCRGTWPDAMDTAQSVGQQLRSCRTRKVAKLLSSLDGAVQAVQRRFDKREKVDFYRLGAGLSCFQDNLHSCSSFLSSTRTDGGVLEILGFLDARHVTNFSALSVAARRHCWADAKLRAPNIKIACVRSATYRILASSAKTVLVDPRLGSAVARGLSGLDVVAFSKWLQSAKGVMELTLTAAEWERFDPGASQVASALPIYNLRLLDLSHNGLTDQSATNLADVLSRSGARLEVLTLELNNISPQGFQSLLRLGAGQVHSWGFRHNQLGDESCRILAKTFDPEIKTLGKRRLEVWDLRTNRISAEGCKALAPMIGHMVVARLGCNPLGDAGGEQLASGLGSQLRILDLRQAQLGEAASMALGRKLREATQLQELLLSGNEIGPSGAQSLAEGWAWISSLRVVDLSGNRIGNEGLDLLSDELPFWQQAPFRLSLASTGCATEGLKRLAAALRKNPRHHRQWTIELQNNEVSSASMVEIKRLLEPRDAVPWSGKGF